MSAPQKNILITGGAGFIGSHVVRLFSEKYPGYHIVNLDKLTYAGNLENLADLSAFERWLAATSAGDAPRARFIEAQFSDRLKAAFGPWLALDPLNNPDAPASPLDTLKYERPDVDAAARFEQRSTAAEIAASEAGQAADNFVLGVVLLAAALFLLGIQSRIGIFELRLTMTGIAGVLVVGTTIWVLTLPTSITF